MIEGISIRVSAQMYSAKENSPKIIVSNSDILFSDIQGADIRRSMKLFFFNGIKMITQIQER